ncbi:peptidylprolyl isomerase [Pelagibacteraceae bacterium]|jgi:peptidyl-prolyl cis-trans isomerase SurA|nr:peptidylprolyl isomerase [Pelagibacteraceae bacterium]MDC1158018.1 peptidylprolyl isomerase [Pelagibacteraceae bacterium]
MKKKILIVFLLYILIPQSFLIAKINNKIVIKVENQIITSYEIKNKILTALILADSEINQENINKLKKQAADSLIQLKLKKIELKKYGVKKNDEHVKDYLNSISSNNIESLKNKLLNNNLDYKLFLDEVETQTMWQQFIYKFYSKKIMVDENVIDQELTEYISNNSKIKEYLISEIEILIDEDDRDNKKISDIEQQIKNQGFEKTALKFSISSSATNRGNLGWIEEKSLSDKIRSTVKKIGVGNVSGPIKGQNTILFLKVKDVRYSNAKDINITDLKNRFINRKKNELVELYSISHLSRIRNTSLIEYK